VTSRQLFFLASLTVIWGLNWPVLKLGASELAPLWFRLLCLIGGVLATLAFAGISRAPLAVPAGAWKKIFLLALPNMVLWYLLGTIAITLMPSGRAAILGYTMPVWAALIGIFVFHERPDGRTWAGVACALAGTALLIGGESVALWRHALGPVLMLAAAFAWGVGTHMMRRMRVDMDTFALTFWMMAMAMVIVGMVSAATEFDQWRMPRGMEWAPIAYNAVFVLGFCNVAWFSLARDLPPVASGLSGMLIPVVGVFSGMLLLGEQPQWRDDVALLLILVSLATVVMRPSRSAQATSEH